ncbi:MAG: metallophosphoesterase family protein [Anaerolineae bacterium]
MRILIFADLHANWEALQALQVVESKPDAIFFLGDIVDYGPDPVACLTWIKENVTHAVRGNHDQAVGTQVDCRSPQEYHQLAVATRQHTWRMLREADLTYLTTLPLEERVRVEGTTFYLTHASPGDNLYGALDLIATRQESLEEEMAHAKADVVLVGHTHVPAIRKVGQVYFVNPGSIGQPRHGSPSATYALWKDGKLAIRHVDYDWSRTQQKLSLLPLDPEHVQRLQEILERGL